MSNTEITSRGLPERTPSFNLRDGYFSGVYSSFSSLLSLW